MQVTAFELDKQREADNVAARAASQQREQAQRREVGIDDYDKLVDVSNDNTVDGVDAHGINSALAQMGAAEECALMLYCKLQTCLRMRMSLLLCMRDCEDQELCYWRARSCWPSWCGRSCWAAWTHNVYPCWFLSIVQGLMTALHARSGRKQLSNASGVQATKNEVFTLS